VLDDLQQIEHLQERILELILVKHLSALGGQGRRQMPEEQIDQPSEEVMRGETRLTLQIPIDESVLVWFIQILGAQPGIELYNSQKPGLPDAALTNDRYVLGRRLIEI
jgi:hypothetical protein